MQSLYRRSAVIVRSMDRTAAKSRRAARLSVHVKVCGCRPYEGGTAHTGGRRTQTSNGGNRGRCGEVARQTLWGLTAVMPECEHNFCDMARTLRMGENASCRPCNFKELRVVKRTHIATFALCA